MIPGETPRRKRMMDTQFEIGNHDGFILAGTSKRPRRKGTGVIPPAPAQVYHGRRRDSTREFISETAAVKTIKIRFEKMIEKNTKEIDVPSLFKHMAHHFFLAKRTCKAIFNTTDPSGR